jgi:serine protease Do
VVGVNTAIIAGGQGIGFAIPINMAKNIIPQLIKGQKVERGYLGIGLKEVTPELAKSLGFDRPKGVLVALVYAGSPADQAGIAAGDLILSFNGHAIEQGQDLPILVSQSPVGSASEVEIWRDGETKTVKVHMGSSLEGGGQQPAASSPTRGTTQGVLGVAVRDLSSQESRQLGLESGVGVAVTGVQRGSPAAGVGLQAGDVILEINDNNITNSKDFFNSTQGLRSGQVVRIFVRRGPLASYFAFSL